MQIEPLYLVITISKWPIIAMTILYLAVFLEAQNSTRKDRRREALFGVAIALVTYFVLLTEHGQPWLSSLLTATLLLIFSPVFITLMTLAKKRTRTGLFRNPSCRMRFFAHVYSSLLLFLPDFRANIISQQSYELLATGIIIVTMPLMIMAMRKIRLQEAASTTMEEEQKPQK